MKKRLQANLENLTPKEAGRLLVIYAHEAMTKKGRVLDYPPVKELWAALEARVDKSRGKPENKKAVDAHNGLVFLAGLFETVNIEGPNLFIRTAFAAYQVKVAILMLIQEDALSTLIRTIRGHLTGGPQPVSKADYDRAVAWANGEQLITFTEVIEAEIESEEGDRWDKVKETLPDISIPVEFATAHVDPAAPLESVENLKAMNRKLHQAWADDQGDRLLNDVFDGDWKRLQAWIEDKDPEYQYTDEERTAREETIRADLVAKLKAGELVGGDAFYAEPLFAPVLIENGTIPAWVALRVLWRPYVESRSYRIYYHTTTAGDAPYGVDEIRQTDGRPLSRDQVAQLVADFLKACRGRPWGKKLPTKPDIKALTVFLTQSGSHLLHLNAPDLGRVDFQSWAKYDGEGLQDWRVEPAATAASLHAAVGGYDYGESWVEDYFYVHPHPSKEREALRHAFALMNSLDSTRQPFTYRSKKDEEEGLMPLSDLLGFEFLTPLESAVRQYQDIADKLVSIRAALTAVADRYFDGLQVLTKEQAEPLEEAEAYIAEAGESLKEWLDRLAEYPWNVDTSTLDPGDPEIDEELVEWVVGDWLHHTRRKTKIQDETGLIW